MKILPVIAYHKGDIDITKKLLTWIKDLHDLGKVDKNRTCLMVSDASISDEEKLVVGKMAKAAFGRARTILVAPSGPHAPTSVFLAAAEWIYKCVKGPFLWLEPDCIPLSWNWLGDIENAYKVSPMRFMGPLIRQQSDPTLPSVHLTGCSVYPSDAFLLYDEIETLKTANVAWDIESASAIVPRCEDTKLIRHFWGTKEQPPLFVDERKPDSLPNHQAIEFAFRDGAVLFHRSKDGTLIDLLRKKYSTVELQPVPEAPAVPEKRKPGRPKENKVAPAMSV
jgi:hypothetical protein